MKNTIDHATVPTVSKPRRGVFVVIGVICLIGCLTFVAYSVDIGYIAHTKTRMENAADAAALAAAMEITHAVQTAPIGTTDIPSYARAAAALKAAEVSQLNGFHLDGAATGGDVLFGKRYFDEATGKFLIDWNIAANDPANVLKVSISKDNPDTSQPDGQLPTFFAGIFGRDGSVVRAEATAYVEARDIVVVHDFSRSMNFDSHFSDESTTQLPDSQIVANMQACWDDLQPVNMGTLGFTPQWLTVSKTNPNVSVTFRYHTADVVSADTLKTVRLFYTDGNSQTINTSGTTGTYTGTSSNSTKNLSRVDVTTTVTIQIPQSASVTQSGSPTLYYTFAANRQSVSISASSSWNRVGLTFSDGSTQTITTTANSGTYSGTGGNSGKIITSARVRYGSWRSWVNAPAVTYTNQTTDTVSQFDDTDANVKTAFGLYIISYPYPPGSWDDYISYVRNSGILHTKGYRETYGGLTFVQYIIRNKSSHSQTPALATARHYPFHAIKLGHIQMCDFLESLAFDDKIGMVSYDNYSRIETTIEESPYPYVNISAEPLSSDYDAVADLMRYKQCNHYYSATNIGAGVRDAITLLDNHKRAGARPNILLTTDGNANTTNGDTTLPSGWQSWFDGYDGPGSTFTTSQSATLQTIHEVKRAIDKGYVIHTMAVGADADWRTMKAIAFLGKGEFIHVNGGTSTADLQAQLDIAFHKIAGLVPPAKLMTEVPTP